MMKTSVVLFIVCVAAVTANQQREELRKNQAAAPVALVTKEKADLIAVDEDNVYWVSDKAAIRKVSKSGGTPETLVAGEMEIKEIIVNGDQIFFRTDRELRRVSRQGGSPTTLAAYNGDCYRCLAVDDINVYFINWPDASSGQLMKVSKEGSALIVLASGIRFPKGLAADGKRVYWVDYANDSIKSVSSGGGMIATLGDCLSPEALAIDEVALYCAESRGILRFGKADKTITTLAKLDTVGISQISVDQKNLYVLNFLKGLYRIDKNTGRSELLAPLRQVSTNFAIDASSIYWANSRQGTIMRLLK